MVRHGFTPDRAGQALGDDDPSGSFTADARFDKLHTAISLALIVRQKGAQACISTVAKDCSWSP
jgi:hypothetical protein